ncbi:hypothetical protein [Actinacidiphila oryziradicis]|uniref:Uncharacterized protein n=1 Tax=Actinacidiphila oryziradicis TaxID=2571141 RepID=A0A4U0S870_9ACTN|nr:hypothetical protein [Actinacidiphila oryziradicis]TKA04743.1 hypothetical protein FCI23_34875 [Actinacidiphila oryziradicis]
MAVLAVPVAAVLVLLAWVLADAARTRRLTTLIKAARTTPAAPTARPAPEAQALPARRTRR